MDFGFHLSSLIPDGLIARRFDVSDDIITIFANESADQGSCSSHNEVSDRVHNRYILK